MVDAGAEVPFLAEPPDRVQPGFIARDTVQKGAQRRAEPRDPRQGAKKRRDNRVQHTGVATEIAGHAGAVAAMSTMSR